MHLTEPLRQRLRLLFAKRRKGRVCVARWQIDQREASRFRRVARDVSSALSVPHDEQAVRPIRIGVARHQPSTHRTETRRLARALQSSAGGNCAVITKRKSVMGNQQNRDSDQNKKQEQDKDQEQNINRRNPQEDQGKPDPSAE